MAERVGPAENDVDRHAFPALSGPDRRGQHFEVLDGQHFHDLFAVLSGPPPVQRRGYVASARRCQVAGVSAVSAVGTVLTPAAA